MGQNQVSGVQGERTVSLLWHGHWAQPAVSPLQMPVPFLPPKVGMSRNVPQGGGAESWLLVIQCDR